MGDHTSVTESSQLKISRSDWSLKKKKTSTHRADSVTAKFLDKNNKNKKKRQQTIAFCVIQSPLAFFVFVRTKMHS